MDLVSEINVYIYLFNRYNIHTIIYVETIGLNKTGNAG